MITSNTYITQKSIKCIALGLTVFILNACGGSSDDFSPSANSDTLLFSSNPTGHNELSRLQDGITQVLLSNPTYDYWWPKVSPDKSKFLVYRSPATPTKNHDNYKHADLMLFDMDGNNPQTLISKGQYGWVSQGVSRWNNDGSKILMASEQVISGSSVEWRLVLTDAAGNNPKNLSDWWIIDPNFSPDNKSIVFIAFPNDSPSVPVTFSQMELHRADYDAVNNSINNIERLTFNNSRDHDPSYSPDGSKIVFSAGNEDYSNVDIVVYDVTTKTETTVVDDTAANGGSMDWSNDGESIYFHSLNVNILHPYRIKRVDISNSTVNTLLETPTNNFGFYHPEIY